MKLKTVATLKQSGASFYTIIEELDENTEMVTLEQNLEVPSGDHWRINFSLQRWRSKTALLEYLKSIITVVESAP